MPLKCHLEYLDENGQKSADYYNNLHLGSEQALNIYLNKNKNLVLTRFQKSSFSLDDFFNTIVNISDAKKNAAGERIYELTDASGSIFEIQSATKTVEEVTNPFTKEQFSEDYVIARKASDILFNTEESTAITLGITKEDFKTFKNNYSIYGYAAINPASVKEFMFDAAKNYYATNKAELESKKTEIQDKWDSLTEIGTDTHNIVEQFFKLLGEDLTVDPKTLITKAVQAASSSYVNDADAAAYLESVIKLVFNNPELPQLKNIANLKVLPELKIVNPGKTKGGRLDLLIIDAENNAYIFDIKTKELGKEALFKLEKTRMKAPVSNLYDNKLNHATIQTSVYHSALEEWGVFGKIRSFVIYTEGKLTYTNGVPEYSTPKATELIKLEYKKAEIDVIEGLDHLKRIKESATYEDGKLNDANEITRHLFNVDIDDLFDGDRLEKRIADILDSPETDSNGNQFFYSRLPEDSKGRRYFKSDTRAERILEIRDYYETLKKDSSRIADKFITYANNPPKNSKDKDLTMDNLLKPYDRKFHNFQKLNSLPGYEHFPPTIIIAVNTVSGEGSIINLNTYFEPLEREVSKGANNIFGSFINNLTFKKLIGPGVISLEYTKANAQLLRGAMIAVDLQKKGHIKSIKQIGVGVVDSNSNIAPINLGLNRLLPYLKVINTILEDGDIHSVNTKEMLNLKNVKTLASDHLEIFLSYLNAGATEDFRLITNHKDAIKQTLFDFSKNPKIGTNELLKALVQAHNYLGNRLNKELEGNRELIALDPEYQLLSQMILQINNAHIMAGDIKEKLTLDVGARVMSNIDNEAIRQLDKVIKENNLKINNKLVEWSRKKDKILKALMDSKSINLGTTIINNDITSIFDNLWVINPKNVTDEDRINRANDLFMLKDVEDLDTQEEKDFVNFFKETILDSLKISLSAADYQKVVDEKTWKKYMVPLLPASMINKISNEEDVKKKFNLMLQSFSKTTKKAASKELEEINMAMDNDFLSQLGPGTVQNGKARREMLKITADGKITGEMDTLETNLERIMTMFFLKSVSGEQHNKTMSFHNCLNAVALYEEFANFNKTEDVRKAMDIVTTLRVKNEVKEEGKLGRTVDYLQRGFSVKQFGLSIKMITMEAATNSIASLGATIVQSLMGKYKAFNIKNWGYASSYVVGRAINNKSAIITQELKKAMGLYNSDPVSWGKKEKRLTNKNGLFQSRWLFFLNNGPFQEFKTIHIFAELDRMGCLKQMDIDENNNLIYNYTTDPRFEGIFDSAGNLKTTFENDELKKKAALYEYYLAAWTKDGTLNSEGKPTIPVSHEQIISMQDRSLSTFGSMDNDAALLFQYHYIGRMFLKYKSWFAAKKDNYWTPSHISKVRGRLEWVEDPDHPQGGSYNFQYDHVEGILQTLQHVSVMTYNMIRNKDFKASNYKELSPRQRENLTKVAVDLALMTLLYSIITGAMDDKDDIFGSGIGKEIGKTLKNSVGDLNMWATTDQMIAQNPLALLGEISRTISSLKNAVVYSATGDFDKAGDYMLKMFGATSWFAVDSEKDKKEKASNKQK